MGFGSRELGDRAAKNPVFFGVLATVSQGRLMPVPWRRADQGRGRRNVLGAVGISGDTSDKDEVVRGRRHRGGGTEGGGGGLAAACASSAPLPNGEGARA